MSNMLFELYDKYVLWIGVSVIVIVRTIYYYRAIKLEKLLITYVNKTYDDEIHDQLCHYVIDLKSYRSTMRRIINGEDVYHDEYVIELGKRIRKYIRNSNISFVIICIYCIVYVFSNRAITNLLQR